MTKTLSQKCWKAAAGILLSVLLVVAAIPMQSRAASYTADTTFTFSESAIAASGSTDNYEIDGTDLKITASGTYVVTGSCSEGSVTVKKGTTGVTLVLRDLSLASSITAPVSCNKSTEVAMILEGSSTLTDKEDPANEDSADEEVADAFEGAALKVKSGASLTISGNGTLTADGSSCKNAVKGAATAVITVESGTINAKAANNGLASDGSVIINGGTVNVTADNDGIKSEPDEDDADSAGTVTINGGTVSLDVTGDGIQSTGDLNINGGNVIVNADDDAINSDANITVKGGTLNIEAGDDAIHADSVLTVGTKGSDSGPDITVSSCEEGLEGAQIYLNSGSAVINANDDGVNAANKDLSDYNFLLDIEGGSWTINANGDGLDSNKDIVVNGGTTLVFGSVNNGNGAMDYEGTCTVNSGSLLCVGMSGMAMGPSTGTYVMFGNTGTGMGGQMGQMPAMNGNMSVRPDDGQDSQTESQDGADKQMPAMPDRADEQTTNGQRSQRSGQNNEGMQRTASEDQDSSGTQLSVTQGSDNSRPQMQSMPENMGVQPQDQDSGSNISISAGSTLVIKDASGNTLLETTAKKNANNVMFASDSLENGSTYTLYINGTEAGTATASEGNGRSGGMPGQPGENGGQSQMPGQTDGNSGQPQVSDQSGVKDGQSQTTDQTVSNEQQTDASASTYTDVKSDDWFAPAVEFVSKKKYMVGTSGTTFEPEGLLNRAMMVQILYNIEGKPQVSKSSSYKDVNSSDWYADAVAWAEENKLVLGYGNGSFGATDALTREQAAVLLKRYAEYKGLSLDINADLSSYSDADRISDWALDSMKFAVGLKLINGTSASTLDPSGTATRAQMAQILANFLQ